MIEKCKKLYLMKRRLLEIFELIKEHDNWVKDDTNKVMGLNELSEVQKKYLEYSLQGLSRLTNKINIRISKLRQEHSENSFIISNKVLYRSQ